ncbi:unnamed protein product [Prorocentrum cordatum]|uniref:Uncharacterized protein n=1 Tax=Prorocentrum cordatum TaxID=2364126 RepID=A0ABN9SRH2_9DINO|nr:unnamed protein product [Polarella glacialis]
MMESCHACDAALGIQVVMSKTGKRDAATDHRNMLITAAPRSSSDPDPLPALCNALLQQPLLASAFDQFYPFRAVFDVLKAEKLFELTAEKPLGCGDNAAFELCELSEDSLEHYVTEELRAAVRLHFGDVSSPEACSNNPFLLKVHVCPRGSLLAKVIDMASVLLEKVVLEVLGPDIASKDSMEKVARMAAGSNQNTRTLCVGLWRGHGAVSCVGISLTRVADEFDPARLGPDMRRALPGSTSLGKCWRHRLYELSLRAHSNQIAEDVELLGEFERVLSLDSASSPAVVFHPGTVLAAGETGQFLDCLPGLPTFALHGADILTSRPEESAVAPLVLLDLGPRAGWQRAVDLLVEACVTWGPRPELFILRLTASDCGKADQRRGYKGWQQSVTIRVFSALRERIGTDHSLSLQVNHLLSDEGAERTLLLRRRAKTELPCQS